MMASIFLERPDATLALVVFGVAVAIAVEVGVAFAVAVGVVLPPLPPTGVALTGVAVVGVLVPPVVEAAPLAGACKIFPTDEHMPALVNKSG
jgi:hypothetical protein